MGFFDTFDWNKAAQGQFAPPAIPGNAQSAQAVQTWQNLRPDITPDILEASRGPAISPTGGVQTVPADAIAAYAGGRGSLPQPAPGNFGLNKGFVDPTALKALAQNLPYDLNARRNAITAQLIAGPGQAGTTSTAAPSLDQQMRALDFASLQQLAGRQVAGDPQAAAAFRELQRRAGVVP